MYAIVYSFWLRFGWGNTPGNEQFLCVYFHSATLDICSHHNNYVELGIGGKGGIAKV